MPISQVAYPSYQQYTALLRQISIAPQELEEELKQQVHSCVDDAQRRCVCRCIRCTGALPVCWYAIALLCCSQLAPMQIGSVILVLRGPEAEQVHGWRLLVCFRLPFCFRSFTLDWSVSI